MCVCLLLCFQYRLFTFTKIEDQWNYWRTQEPQGADGRSVTHTHMQTRETPLDATLTLWTAWNQGGVPGQTHRGRPELPLVSDAICQAIHKYFVRVQRHGGIIENIYIWIRWVHVLWLAYSFIKGQCNLESLSSWNTLHGFFIDFLWQVSKLRPMYIFFAYLLKTYFWTRCSWKSFSILYSLP